MPLTFDDLDAAESGVTQSGKQQGRSALLGAMETNPDEYAKAKQLGDANALPAEVVMRNYGDVQRQQKLKELDALEANAPKTAVALQDPGFAKLAHDDTDNLAAIEQTIRPTINGAAFSSVMDDLRKRNPALDQDTARSIAAQRYNVDNSAASFLQEPSKPSLSLGSFISGLYEQAKNVIPQFREQARVQFSSTLGLSGMEQDASRRYQQIQSRNDLSSPDFTGAPGAGLAYSGAANILQNVPGLTLALLTRNPYAAIAPGVAQTEVQAYADTRARGGTVGQSTLSGGLQAAVEGATEYLPMDFLIHSFGRKTLTEIVAGEQVREQFGEQIATHLQDAIDTAIANPDKTWGDYFKERPDAALQTAVAVLMQSAVVAGAGAVGNSVYGAAARAEDQASAIQRLGELGKASKLNERDPRSFAQFVDAAAADGPVQDIYVDARTFAQSAGEHLADIAQASPSVAAQLDEALQTGGDIRIPLGEYASAIAPSDANAALLPHLRTSPEGMSMEEAKTFMQGQADEFKQEAEKVLAQHEFDDGFKTSAANVEKELLGQLAQANRFTPDVNAAYAKLMASFYTVQAARLGITPEQMYVKYPLQVRAEALPGGNATMDQLDHGSVALRALADKGNKEAVFAQALVNGARLSPQHLANIFEGEPSGTKVDRLGSVPALAPVLAEMRRAILDDPKVLDAVVGSVPVNVVNDLFGTESAAKVALHDEAMLQDSPAFDAELPVTSGAGDTPDPVGLLVREAAFSAAKAARIALDSGMKTPEGGAAVVARDVNSLNQGSSPRAQISFGSDITSTPTIISLLSGADLSSFLHESGHFYLEVLNDIAQQPDAPAEVAADMDKLLKWFGVKDIATWNAMSVDEKRPYHEQLARGFESYVFEGKAPSAELDGLFSRFRAWLLNVYRNLQNLHVSLTDEVRGVFDRMLASNDQILAAEASRNFAPLFKSAEAAGMTADEWQSYQDLGFEATQDAVTNLQRRSLRDMQWLSNARSATLRKLQREAAAKRKEVRAEVAGEVRREPIYAAAHWLKSGEMADADGNTIKAEGGFKLDATALREMYPESMLARPDLSKLGVGKYGLVGKEGLDPNLVAEMFGFTSGDELVRKLLDAEPERATIEGLTDQRMLERYGDLSSQGAINAATDAAIHNEARAKFVATELRALAKATGQKNILVKAAKEFAAASIARRNIGDIRPAQFAASEARAARAAEKAQISGNLVEAATEKRNQLVNNYATKAAHEALDDVQKGLRYLKRVGESTTIDPDYREQIAGLLDRFDLRKISNKDAARRKSLLEWVESQKEQGFEPVIDLNLLNEAQRKPYREMSVEEFRGLVDAVRNIEHLGRLKHKLLTAADQRDFAAHVADAVQVIEANAKRTLPVKLESNTWADKMKSGTAEFFAMHRKFASLIREMSGFQDGGALWETFSRPMNQAGDTEAVMREKATVELSKIFEPILKTGRLKEKTFIPEINASLSREGRITVALNTGNAGNLQRLMDGDRWSGQQVKAITDSLTKPEWDFVQAIWDHIDSYRGEIGALQKKLTGVEPEWIQATPVQTPHGEYRGGYFPAKYDTSRSTRSLSDEAAANIMDQWRATRGSPKTRDSFTKGRADKVSRPLRKDFGVITQHITEVTHRLAWQEFLTDANRLLRAAPIDNAIRDHYGPEVLKAMRDTVQDIAAGEVGAQNAFERGINYLRSGATVAGLGWRLTTSLLQPIGLTQSMVRIGPKYVGRGLAEWIGDSAKMENTAKRIFDKSDMMRLRAKTMQREISEIRNKVAGKTSAIEASYFYLIQKLQLVADIPTWLGQYHKSVELGSDEATAIAQADQAVLDAQGGGQIKDLAAIQRGGPMLKLFTNFYSFFNTTYQLTSESFGRTKFTNPLSVGRLAVDMLLLYSVPAALSTLLKAALHGDDDWDKFVKQLIADQLQYLLGTMVGLRELGGVVTNVLGLQGGDYQGPASVRVFAELAKLGKQVGQGEVDEALLKSADNVGGILFHYPSGQLNATATGLYHLSTGGTDNPGALIVGASAKP